MNSGVAGSPTIVVRCSVSGLSRLSRIGTILGSPIDLYSDLNAEDDYGQNWALPRNAADPARVKPGAVHIAGTARYWSVVRITAVDADGQVHFLQLGRDDPAARQLLATIA